MAIWFVFLDSVSVLRFNFVFFVCVFPVGDAYFRFGIRVSVFWWLSLKQGMGNRGMGKGNRERGIFKSRNL